MHVLEHTCSAPMSGGQVSPNSSMADAAPLLSSLPHPLLPACFAPSALRRGQVASFYGSALSSTTTTSTQVQHQVLDQYRRALGTHLALAGCARTKAHLTCTFAMIRRVESSPTQLQIVLWPRVLCRSAFARLPSPQASIASWSSVADESRSVLKNSRP